MQPQPPLITNWLRYLAPYRLALVGAVIALIITASSVLLLGQGMRYLIDEGISKQNRILLDQGLIFVCLIIILLAAGSFTRFYLITSIAENVIADIKKDLYQHLLKLPCRFFEKTKAGEILSRLNADTSLLQILISSSFSTALRNGIMLIGGLTMMIITSHQLAAIVGIVIICIIFPIIILGKKVRILSKQAQASLAELSAHTEETIYGIKTIQAYTREFLENQRFIKLTNQALANSKLRITYRSFLTAMVILFVFGSVAFVLWVGGQQVIDQHISSGQLSAFLFYSVLVAASAGSISEVIGDVQRAFGAMERLKELQREPTFISELTDETMRLDRLQPASLCFQQVHFHYPTNPSSPSLTDINFVVAPGEMVAIVGPSGAGKSTIFELILRFYDPQSGQILINNQPITQLGLQNLREFVGIVPQNPVIFSNTAFENIHFGNPEASNEAVIHAAKSAACYDFISQLPQGFDTYLGEKGVRISGGEKQRIAIARLFIKNPQLLLLDEATSSLDSANEQLVQNALEAIMQNRTSLIIAHRLSTIQKADRIIVLEKGKIVETGTHQSLIKANGLYASLSRLQFQGA